MTQIKKMLHSFADTGKARLLRGFFKTGKGEYGEGDVFIGVTMPQIRSVAKAVWRDVTLTDVKGLLKSAIHEERMLALVVLTHRFAKGDEAEKKRIFDLYMASTRRINNWDLVDVSVGRIVGVYLLDKDRSVLYERARSPLLWDRRIAMVATGMFIRHGQLDDTFALADILLFDTHDLMHKAVGWMLREAGKKDLARLSVFLKERAPGMPRTMLRYAIEKYPEPERRKWLSVTYVQKNPVP
jgi:3-methyladenine DNA glycosylase AlkD